MSRQWRENAACRGHPTEWWFPALGRYDDPEARQALALCAVCPVADECRDAGESEPAGIWGGQSGRARKGRTRSGMDLRTRDGRRRRMDQQHMGGNK